MSDFFDPTVPGNIDHIEAFTTQVVKRLFLALAVGGTLEDEAEAMNGELFAAAMTEGFPCWPKIVVGRTDDGVATCDITMEGDTSMLEEIAAKTKVRHSN